MNESETLEAIARQNPSAMSPAEAVALIRAESGGRLDTIPASVTVLDSPAGTFYDKSSIIAAVRHDVAMAVQDASVVAVQSK